VNKTDELNMTQLDVQHEDIVSTIVDIVTQSHNYDILFKFIVSFVGA